jgi:chromosome segregation ATPase
LAARLALRFEDPLWVAATTVGELATQLGSLVGLDDDGYWLSSFYSEEAAAVAGIWPVDASQSLEVRLAKHEADLQALAGSLLDNPATKPREYRRYPELEEISWRENTVEQGYVSVVKSLQSAEAEIASFAGERATLQSTIDSLNSEIDSLKLAARHSELSHRDYVMGLQAQVFSVENEKGTIQADLHKAYMGISGFIAQDERRLRRIKKLESALAKSRAMAKSRAVAIQQLRASRTWRIGRLFTNPFSRRSK